MIVPVIAAAIVGAVFGNRGRPRTRCEQKVVLGARTGRTYDVEEFAEAGFLVVRAPDGAYGVFQHVQQKSPSDPRFSWRGGKGAGESLHGMCLDLGLVRDAPAPGAESSKAESSGSGSSPGQDPTPKTQDPPSSRPRPTAVPSPKTGT